MEAQIFLIEVIKATKKVWDFLQALCSTNAHTLLSKGFRPGLLVDHFSLPKLANVQEGLALLHPPDLGGFVRLMSLAPGPGPAPAAHT